MKNVLRKIGNIEGTAAVVIPFVLVMGVMVMTFLIKEGLIF